LTPLPATPTDPDIENVSNGPNGVNFDYYASMAMRNNNNNSLTMYGIKDDPGTTPSPPAPAGGPQLLTRFVDIGATKSLTPYSEPQPDPGGYYTDAVNAPIPSNAPRSTEID